MKKLYSFIVFIIFLNSNPIVGQKYDFKWLLGYSFIDNPNDTGFGCSFIDFNTPDGNPIVYEDKFKKIDFFVSSANICDENGNYLFSCNGGYVEGPNDQLMPNADLLDGEIKYPELGTALSQAELIIPYPGKPDQYILFHKASFYYPNYGIANSELFYSIIDMKLNNGNGRMISRRNSLLKDTLDDACLIGVKHANGRDWWVIISEDTEVGYYIFLVTDTEIKLFRKQVFPGSRTRAESGQSFFSNNGNLFASATVNAQLHYYNLHFFNFDRCDGILNNYQLVKVQSPDVWYPGCSFSIDDKFIYLSTHDSLYQFSILNNLLVDKIVIQGYDGFLELHPGNFAISTLFGMMQSASDGRIYNCATSDAFDAIHVINRPNEKGISCQFAQRGLNSTSFKSCIPNFPNYRLGPIDGSVCDSLGINNIPWCHWRYNQDTLDYLNFSFTDLSAYEVEQWCWDFGDPQSASNTSANKNPIHKFSANGIYNVCLIVKNKNGMDTLCRTIKIGNVVSNESTNISEININAWPNPCKDNLIVNVIDYNPEKMNIYFYNQLGEKIKTERLFQGSNFLDVHNLVSGIYNLSFAEKGKVIKQSIILKI
jgi:hypothetical protein